MQNAVKKLVPLVALLMGLYACVETPKPVEVTPPAPVEETPPPVVETANPVPPERRLDTLPGWDQADMGLALEALKATCRYKSGTIYAAQCEALKTADVSTDAKIRAFFLSHFAIEAVEGEGLMTGYYVPEYEARSTPDAEFMQPVRDKPDDLVVIEGSKLTPPSTATKIAARKDGDRFVPYYTRAEIEAQPSDATVFMRPEDYFYMQLQGSAFLTFPDGHRVYSAYAADNGQPFVGIAKVMVEKNYLAANETSGDNIHAWLADHRGPEAQSVMNANPRYAFFLIRTDVTEGIGAANIGLPPKAAIAVDPSLNPLGTLFWLDANAGTLSGSFPSYQRMVAALDTGGAIKGKVRADYYLGIGKTAGTEAGRIKHKLKMWKIVPFQ